MTECSLDRDALNARLAEWQELDRAALSRRETSGVLEVRYRLEPGLAERLLELIAAEAECCPGLTFDATVTLSVHSSA
jgi:hypothetical protein